MSGRERPIGSGLAAVRADIWKSNDISLGLRSTTPTEGVQDRIVAALNYVAQAKSTKGLDPVEAMDRLTKFIADTPGAAEALIEVGPKFDSRNGN